MPRNLRNGLAQVLKNGSAESHTWLILTLPSDIAPSENLYLATAPITIDGVKFDGQLRTGSAVKTSITRAADRASVEVQNVDTVFGVDSLRLADSLYGAKVQLGRYWRDLQSGATFSHGMLTGIVASVEINENVVKLGLISDVYSTINVGASEQVVRKCRWQIEGRFRGTECGYSGALLTCNGLYDSADGCEGRHGSPLKQAKYGGFAYIESASTIAGAAALPIPASNQLLKTVNLTTGAEVASVKQQPFLALDDDRFHTTNNNTNLWTEIAPKGMATGYENAVDDYNAVIDGGVTNTTTELQAAINAAEAAGGGTVYLNPGIYKTTGITLTGRVKLVGSFEGATIIYSTTNAPIIDCVGSAFFLPVVENITVRGSKTAGTSQIGIKVDSAGDCLGARIDKVKIQTTGGTGLYVGTVFSSVFRDIFLDDCAGYPVEINSPFQPNLYFENVYPGTLGASYPVGFMVRQGQNITFNNCNGLNSIPLNSAWMVLGQKTGLYGAASDTSVNAQLINCNIESYHTYGIRCLRNSSVQLIGKNTFARAAISTTLSAGIDNAVTSIPLTGNLTTLLFPTSGDPAELLVQEGGNTERMTVTSRTTSTATVVRGTPSYAFTTAAVVYSAHARGIEYDVDDVGAYPSFFTKATIADESGIQDGTGNQELYYHGQFFHANELPPAALVGEGMSCTQSPGASTYWNDNRSRIEPLYRVGDNRTRTTITGDYAFTMPGARYIACEVSAATAITLWWASWERHPKTVIIADLSGNAATNNITISAGGGGTINGGTVTINQNYGAVELLPDPETGDWRIIAVYGGSGITGSGSSPRLAYWSGASALTSVSGLEYDSGSSVLKSPGRFWGADTAAGAPTFSFINDTDTGFYLSSTGVTGYASGGGNVLLLRGDGLTVAGDVTAKRAIGSGPAPSISTGTGAGTGPSSTVADTELACYVSITTGTTPSANAKVFDLTFSVNAPNYYQAFLQPVNAASAALSGTSQVFVDDASAAVGKVTIKSGSAALAATTTYDWYVFIVAV